jgi:NAD(P)-dependent dehydrogenase (short-subunit alcohol dehydrogenase family)
MGSSSRASKPRNNLLLDGAGAGVLVTGAAGGIGEAVVARFVNAGARVFSTDLAFPDGACSTDCLAADLTDEGAVAGVVADAQRAMGRIDHVVHCAGAVGGGPLHELATRDWRRGIDINLTSAFLLARAVRAPLTVSSGALVLMSSPNGVHGGSALSGPAYAAAKAGVLNLTRYLAKEWAPLRIRVNCVIPGAVDTPMLARLSDDERATLIAATPLKRLTTADDVAGVCAFLCSSHARSITGAALSVTGGRLLP